MEERRRNKRTDLQSKLIIKRLSDNDNAEVTINILDVSKSGIGFVCKSALNMGEVYESYLTIWTKEVIHTCLQIVRIEVAENEDDGFMYGAVFLGMSETDAYRIELYQTINDRDE